ncbi:unnamed protein product [Taenia asiatica]|uniref:Protocadherin-16 n=1 Tax=Taenia asiatica TaxID=60517 RepID=A0A158R8H8_TAEAS|nr:unnamed protein product [Taenia asiatica]
MQGLLFLFPTVFLLPLSKCEQLQFQLHYTVRENEPSGHRVGYLDDDLRRQQALNFSRLCGGGGGCKDLRFRLREPSFHLELDETTAMLTTKSTIDFEQLCIGQCRSTLDAYLSVTVNVWQERKLTAFIHVRVQVIDVDDNSVEFPEDIPRPFVLCLKEVIYRKGKTIELPRAVDKDVTPKYSSITYRLEFATSQWVSMKMVELSVTNDSRPLLVLKEDLDYEDVKEYGFSLVACNPDLQSDSSKTVAQEAQLPIVIQVLNINDMEPVFPQSVYSVEVPEDVQPGMVIIELKAIDRDADAVLTYSINSAPGMNLSTPFEVEPDGKVRLRESFDFEQRTDYNLPIRASDGDFAASTRLHIRLLDINDEAPTFIVNPTSLTVEENQPPNVLVGQVVVRDADTFAVNGYLECAEPPEDAGRQPLRFEQRTESLQSSLESTAVPELHFDLYTRYSLDREDGAPVRLARLVCWDGGGGGSGAEGEEVPYSDVSTATAGRSVRLTSTLTMSVYVQDRNDNAPVFTQSTFSAELKENSDIRKEILQLTSKDYDTEENAITRYRLTDENEDASLFYLNEETGRLYAMTRFDRETRDIYHLQVVAYDASQNPLEIPGADHQSVSTAVVTVRIIDVNDHAPIIQETGELILPENKESGFLVGQVVATDLDAGVNGEVTFDIAPDDPRAVFNGPQLKQVMGFRMTPNGSIFSTRQFDREAQSRYCFQVQAKDKSPESSLSSTARVCVNILDVNDNSPIIHSIEGPDARYERDSLVQKPPFSSMESFETQYSLASYELPSLRISMNEAPGYCALLIQATDLDEGENAELRYSLNLAANCTPPSMPTSRFAHNLEDEREENGETEFRRFPLHTFRIDERTGKLLLVRRLSNNELGSYCLGLVVEDQGHPPLKSTQLIELVIEDVPSRGNWLGVSGNGKNNLNHGLSVTSSRIEAKNILIVIVLSTVSAFLAAVLISAILCMVRPFHKSRRRRGGDMALNGGVSGGSGTMKLSPFAIEPHTSPTLLMHPRSGALSCSDSATLDGCSAVGEGTWIVGTTGTLISAYDGNEMKNGTFRLQTDGMAPIWSPMRMASSDCTFETESLIPVGIPSETTGIPISSGSTLQRGQHFLLHQSPVLGCPLSRGHTIEMVAVPCGQDEQRSDSGRGASDEEVMFQGPFQPILCGIPVTTAEKVSHSATLAPDHRDFISNAAHLETSDAPVTTSGIYLCASSLAGQTGTVSTASGAEERPQRSVSTFVTAIEKESGSLPRSEVPLTLVGNVNKTFSLPREGLCMTQSLLDDHTADESANRLCQEIDHLLFDNMI